MTSFAEFIEQNRERLLSRHDEMLREIGEIRAELAAMDAYEAVKKRGPMKFAGRPPGSINRTEIDPTGETMSVPEAGKRFLGLSESGSWLAWRRGDIPSVKIGRYRRVPVEEMRRKLEERGRPSRSKTREEEDYPGSLVPAQ